MVKPQLIQEYPLTLAEVKAELEKVKARDSQLSFRAGKCEEYINDFVTITSHKAIELRKKLEELKVTRLKTDHIIFIADLLPQTVDDLKVIFSGSSVGITKKEMEQIFVEYENRGIKLVVRGDNHIEKIEVDGVEDKRLKDVINDALKEVQKKISGILDQYGFTWSQIMPDIDEEIWQGLEQDMRSIRSKFFRARYPRLYDQTKKQG